MSSKKRTTKGKGLANSKIADAPPVEAEDFHAAMYDPDLSWNQNNYNARVTLSKAKRARVRVAPEAYVRHVTPHNGRGISASSLKTFYQVLMQSQKTRRKTLTVMFVTIHCLDNALRYFTTLILVMLSLHTRGLHPFKIGERMLCLLLVWYTRLNVINMQRKYRMKLLPSMVIRTY